MTDIDFHLAKLNRARQRVARAKSQFSDACAAALRADPLADLACEMALRELETARAALRRTLDECAL